MNAASLTPSKPIYWLKFSNATDDIFDAVRIAREYDLKLTLEHTTEGHLIADELAKEKDIPMAVDPSLTSASRIELRNKTGNHHQCSKACSD